jgi:hypothetical protein
MARLEWEPTPDGCNSAGFRIRRLDGHPACWRLETSDDAVRHGGRSPRTSIHATVLDAKRRAQREEDERVRLARVRGHAAVGVVAGLIFTALFTSTHNAGVFIASMFFLYAALQSLVDAVSVLTAHAWGWTRDPGGPERLNWSSRMVLTAMERIRERQLASIRAEPPPAIIMLPPDPGR